MPEPVIVTLGDYEVPVVPQRHAYLTNKLGKWVTSFTTEGELTTANLMGFVSGKAYEVTCLLIPAVVKRIPEHEFQGYVSAEAYEAGEYDEEADHSPTMPEILHALETAVKVNRFDVFKALTSIVDPKMLRSLINAKVAEQILTTSQNSPGESGAADQTSSGTTTPTSPTLSAV
jgi:hypothetical protein